MVSILFGASANLVLLGFFVRLESIPAMPPSAPTEALASTPPMISSATANLSGVADIALKNIFPLAKKILARTGVPAPMPQNSVAGTGVSARQASLAPSVP